MRQASVLVVFLLALVVAGGATARAEYYLLPSQMRNVIEEHGFTVRKQHILVDTATCAGLRRYGVRGAEFGGFSCRATAPDGSVYLLDTVAVTATHFDVTEFGIAYSTNARVENCMDLGGGTALQCINQLSAKPKYGG